MRSRPDDDTWGMRTLILTVAVSLFACASGPKSDLIGTWKSDREATLAAIDDSMVSPEAKELLGEILGDFVIEYRKGTYVSTIDGSTTGGDYEVVDDGPNWVDVRSYSELEQKLVVRRVWIDGDRMWVKVDYPKAKFTEYFARVND